MDLMVNWSIDQFWSKFARAKLQQYDKFVKMPADISQNASNAKFSFCDLFWTWEWSLMRNIVKRLFYLSNIGGFFCVELLSNNFQNLKIDTKFLEIS